MSRDASKALAELKDWVESWPGVSHTTLIEKRCQRALKHLAETAEAFDSGELAELVEAIHHGRNHPLLIHWLEQRRKGGKKPSTTTVKEQRSSCVTYARALEGCGIRKAQARELVALAATKSGAFGHAVTVDMIKKWEQREAEPRSEFSHQLLGSDPRRILSLCAWTLAWNTIEPSYIDYSDLTPPQDQ